MTVCQVHVHRAGFVRMQGKSGPGHPFPELVQRGFGFFFRVAEDDHVVGIPHHFKKQFFLTPQCVFTTASGAEPIAVFGEAGFENGFYHHSHRCLHHAVGDCWNSCMCVRTGPNLLPDAS